MNKLGVDSFKFVVYYRGMTEQERNLEAAKADARVRRWNESVRQVRELCRQGQRDNARLGPFLHPVEGEESD